MKVFSITAIFLLSSVFAFSQNQFRFQKDTPIRKTPNPHGEIITYVKPLQYVTIIDEKDGYKKVKYKEYNGYINTVHFNKYFDHFGILEDANLNMEIRDIGYPRLTKAATPNSEVIMKIKKSSRWIVVKKYVGNDYWYISYKNKMGYLNGIYIVENQQIKKIKENYKIYEDLKKGKDVEKKNWDEEGNLKEEITFDGTMKLLINNSIKNNTYDPLQGMWKEKLELKFFVNKELFENKVSHSKKAIVKLGGEYKVLTEKGLSSLKFIPASEKNKFRVTFIEDNYTHKGSAHLISNNFLKIIIKYK